MHYFKPEEFRCRCGKCSGGYANMDPRLLAMLDEARNAAGVSFVLSSAYRCPVHNTSVGGVKDSSHTQGMAVDIRCVDAHSRFVMVRALLEAGFRRIELAPTWIHVDVDGSKPQDVAFYQNGGKY